MLPQAPRVGWLPLSAARTSMSRDLLSPSHESLQLSQDGLRRSVEAAAGSGGRPRCPRVLSCGNPGHVPPHT